MNKMTTFLAGILLIIPFATSANMITSSGSITARGENSVAYLFFDQNRRGRTKISVNSSDFDTHIYLFNNDGFLDVGDFITRNNNRSPSNSNSWINRVLGAGSYVLAISDFNLRLGEAIRGNNRNDMYGKFDVSIKSKRHVNFASVPEPTTLSLLGISLLGAGFIRRFTKKTTQV
jgi:hypothetical protein